jgi:hypothetical protein
MQLMWCQWVDAATMCHKNKSTCYETLQKLISNLTKHFRLQKHTQQRVDVQDLSALVRAQDGPESQLLNAASKCKCNTIDMLHMLNVGPMHKPDLCFL